jgi:hypothetical protein
MSTVLTYQVNNEESVKKAFNTLMIKFANDKDQVLALMNNNPIAVANADAWTVELVQDVNVYLDWNPSKWYFQYEQFKYNDEVWYAAQEHQAQVQFPPSEFTLSLYRKADVIIPGENYPRWKQPFDSIDAYAVGVRRIHNGVEWENTIPANVFEPGTLNSGWTDLSVPPQQYPNWVQPTGAQDAYALGARVTHNGFNWESTFNANVWEPGVFGWVQI